MTMHESPAAAAANRGFRPEIQGLRAVAVLAVLVFHIWPWVLPGGYVGVDVFFVISGFLITALLLREAENTGRISILRFYERRIRRLLPAATLVLLSVAVAVPLLPEVRWADTAHGIGASALYFQNWWLASQAVDYLASENAPSALLHYWTLSVEEQYYLVWPLLFVVATTLTRSARVRPRLAFGCLVVGIGVASLGYSIFLTPRNPGLAYFATTTRAWELALGGILAILTHWQRLPAGVRAIIGVLGIACIAIACRGYGVATPFPGYAALLPTVGAALVIIAGRTELPWSVNRLLDTKPFQYLGDISYSLYLWHWPVVVFYTQLVSTQISMQGGVAIIAVSCALAQATKWLVEDRFRTPASAPAPLWRAYALASACVAASVFSAAAILHRVDASDNAAVGDIEGMHFTPSLLDARADNPDVYALGCHVDQRTGVPRVCRFGPLDAKVKVAIVGDSHAAQWVPALQRIVADRGWQVSSYTKSACAFADLTVVAGGGRAYDSCDAWNRNVVQALIASKPDLVVVTQSVGHRAYGVADREASNRAIAEGLVRTWSKLEASGIPVVAIRDTPRLGLDVPECLGRKDATFQGCSKPSSQVLARKDPIVAASKMHPSVGLLDFSDKICIGATCPPIISGILVWRDSHHMTKTFAESLSPTLDAMLSKVIEGAGNDAD